MTRVGDPDVLDLISCCIGAEHQRYYLVVFYPLLMRNLNACKKRPSAQQIVEHPFLAIEPEVVLLSTDENKTNLTMQVVFKGMDRLSVKFGFNADTDTAEEVVNEMIHENVLPQIYQQLITGEINRILREMTRPVSDDKNSEEARQGWISLQRKPQGGSTNATLERRSDAGTEASVSRRTSLSELREMEDISLKGKTKAMIYVIMFFTNIYCVLKEYDDNEPIEVLVQDVATATKRGQDKANEWLSRLNAQDIMTVGDMRELHDVDWSNLYVFLRNVVISTS